MLRWLPDLYTLVFINVVIKSKWLQLSFLWYIAGIETELLRALDPWSTDDLRDAHISHWCQILILIENKDLCDI